MISSTKVGRAAEDLDTIAERAQAHVRFATQEQTPRATDGP
jgi:hypothetical protein